MTVADQACALGFEEVSYDLSDRLVKELVYLRRVHEGQHQYVSLCFYEGRFLEAVIEVFHCPRHSKAKRHGRVSEQQKRGAIPLYANLARDWETVAGMVGRTYDLAKDP